MTEWLGLLARVVVGGVWVVAGALKLPDPSQSIDAVRAYELLPGSLIRPVGLVLPAVEIVIGLCLILGLLTRWMAAASAVLFVLFIVGIVSAWARGINIDCGCFGGGGYDPDATSKYPWEIARDLALLLASLFLVWRPSTRMALDSKLFPRTPEPEGS